MKSITDHGIMKRNNQLAILRAIRSLGPVSRVHLQKETKLSWGTITSSIKELLDKQIVSEIGSVNTGVGRRPVELDMNTAKHYMVGLRLGSSYIRAIILDLKGNTVAEYKEFVDPLAAGETLVEQLFESVERIIHSKDVGLESVAGIGIAAPGAIDADSGVCLYAPHHPNWKNVHLKASFEQRFAKPCYVDHVNNCTALGQMLFGQGRGVDNFLCVLLGTGISAGVIIDGKVYRGVNCAAGEFGHICIDPHGPDCACGAKGCLEVFASGPALARMGRESSDPRTCAKLNALARGRPENITGETVFQAALDNDEGARSIFRDMGFYLGIGICNLIDLFNPDRVILCGRVSQAHRFFLPTLEKTVNDRAWHISKKEIKVSTIKNPSVLGAAGNVLQAVYNGGLLFEIVRQGDSAARGKLAV